jgi:hypothetical protein
MNEERFNSDFGSMFSPSYDQCRPSEEFIRLASVILVEAVKLGHPHASRLLEEYETWRNLESDRFNNKELLFELRQAREAADVRLIKRTFARTWIYEHYFYYWRQRGVMYAELGDGHRTRSIAGRLTDVGPPMERRGRDFFLDNVVYDRAKRRFVEAASPNADWWEKSISDHVHLRAVKITQYHCVFPVNETLIQEACSRCASTEEFVA